MTTGASTSFAPSRNVVWDLITGREIHCLRAHKSSVNALAVAPGGRHANSGAGDYDGGQLHDPTIRMWELERLSTT
jgi:hypothetical protein